MRVEEPITPERENSIVMTTEKEQVFLDKSKEAVGDSLQIEQKSNVIPLGASIKTMSFGLHMIWLVNVYMLRFYITSFNTWAWKTTSDPSQGTECNTLIIQRMEVTKFVSFLKI